MDILPIKSHRDYRRVLKEIDGLMDARRNSPKGDRLDVLVTLVEAWERKRYQLDLMTFGQTPMCDQLPPGSSDQQGRRLPAASAADTG